MNKETQTNQTFNSKNSLPNPIMLSRQIDGLKEVMRRMQTSQTDSFDVLITKKLENFTHA